jgi:hypothetical protein
MKRINFFLIVMVFFCTCANAQNKNVGYFLGIRETFEREVLLRHESGFEISDRGLKHKWEGLYSEQKKVQDKVYSFTWEAPLGYGDSLKTLVEMNLYYGAKGNLVATQDTVTKGREKIINTRVLESTGKDKYGEDYWSLNAVKVNYSFKKGKDGKDFFEIEQCRGVYDLFSNYAFSNNFLPFECNIGVPREATLSVEYDVEAAKTLADYYVSESINKFDLLVEGYQLEYSNEEQIIPTFVNKIKVSEDTIKILVVKKISKKTHIFLKGEFFVLESFVDGKLVLRRKYSDFTSESYAGATAYLDRDLDGIYEEKKIINGDHGA